MKYAEPEKQEKIRNAESPGKARQLGRKRFNNLRKDWKQVKEVVMTRAVYTKCRTYPHIAEELLDTNDTKLIENSQYDYYWGCGRDRRGTNTYGKVLMKVRTKLLDEQKSTS